MTGAQARTTHYRDLYIGGDWRKPAGTGAIDVLSASTEEVIGSIPEGNAEDVDRAARAARAAFDGWSQTTVAERADWLLKISGALKERSEEIARTISLEVGTPLSMSTP